MQRISTSTWRPRSSVPGLLTAIIVVGLSAFVQAKLLLAEPEIRHIVAVHERQPACIDTAQPLRVDVVATRAKGALEVVDAGLPQRKHPS